VRILDEFVAVWNDSAVLFRADFYADDAQTIAQYLKSKTHKALLRGRRDKKRVIGHTTVYYQDAKRRDIRVLAYDKAVKFA
jgi:hypothetical protein